MVKIKRNWGGGWDCRNRIDLIRIVEKQGRHRRDWPKLPPKNPGQEVIYQLGSDGLCTERQSPKEAKEMKGRVEKWIEMNEWEMEDEIGGGRERGEEEEDEWRIGWKKSGRRGKNREKLVGKIKLSPREEKKSTGKLCGGRDEWMIGAEQRSKDYQMGREGKAEWMDDERYGKWSADRRSGGGAWTKWLTQSEKGVRIDEH